MNYVQRLLVFSCAIVLLSSPTLVGAFGVSPPFFRTDKLLRGSHYEATIFLVQGKPEKDLAVTAKFDVPDKLRTWFSTDKGEAFVIPAGVQQFPIQVRVNVPQNADLGIYKGYLRIITVPKPQEGQQITIATGVRVDINLTVGEGVVQDFTIRKIDILDIRQGEYPKIVVTVENLGNVKVAPTRATFDLFDKYGQIRLGFAQREDLPEVEPFAIQSFVLEFPIDIRLAIGEYWANAQVFKGEAIAQEMRTIFNVIERKAIDTRVFFGIGGVVGIGILGLLVLRRKRRKK